MKHTQGKWIYAGNTLIDTKDPIFYHANIICGGKRVARASGVGEDEAKANAKLIAAAPELLDELAKAHLVINRLVEEIHKADTKSNKIVERISWPTIGELDRKNVIAKATN